MTQTPQPQDGVRTFTGTDLHDLLPQIKQELGEDAIIVARRDGTAGGVGGFFAKRTVELDAMAAPGSVDVRTADEDLDAGTFPDEDPATPAFGFDAYAADLRKPGSDADPDAHGPDRHAIPGQGTGEAPAASDAAAALDAAAAALRAAAAAQPLDDERAPAGPVPGRIPPQEAAAFAQQLAALMGDVPAPAPADAAPAAPAVPDVPDVPATGAPDAGVPVPPMPYDAPGVSAAHVPPPPAPAPPVARDPAAELDDADALVLASVAPAAARPAPVVPDPAAGLGPDGAALLATGLSPALAAELVHTAGAHVAPLAQDTSPRGILRTALASRIPVHAPVRGAGGAVIGFVGPGGSGKTRCVARLATAYARRSPLPVAVIALRPEDGGTELTALLAPAGIAVHAETDAAAAAVRIDGLRGGTIVLLDTPGVSPRSEDELRALAGELHRIAADELHLAVPATMGPLAAREVAEAGRRLGVVGIALTHADETAALGTVVELAIDTGIPLSYVARGTAVDGGMRPAAADALALAMLAPLAPPAADEPAPEPAPAPVHRDDELL